MSAPESSPVGAVFLSYAREDAAAAGRIADALRGFGIEVWLDRNELRGGDAWDSKIRKQIRECGLFVAVVSSTTQGRGEGYFRREWKLAVERTHDMAVGMPFLIPVVVDDTPESAAIVPDEFMRVQWTRLAAGVPSPQFVDLIKRLLESPRRAGPISRPASQPQKPGLPRRRLSASVSVILGSAVVVLAAASFYVTRQSGRAVAVQRAADAPLAPAAGEKSVAVLPFANMSPDKDNEFFADGMHEDVIINLSKIRELKVISRASVLAYRDASAFDTRKIAAELGVATVLEGSVRRVGNKVRVTAQLIDARTDANLWAESYDRDVSDIFAVQAEIAQEIAGALKANLTPGERDLIEARPTQNEEAYDLYLRARDLDVNASVLSKPELDRAVNLYDGAVAKDPTFVLAYVQSAIANSNLYWFGQYDPTAARRERTKRAVDAAVRLAPDLPETHLAQGIYAYRVQRDWARALTEFLTAEKGLPNDAELIFWIGLTYRRLGQGPEALGYLQHSLELNPKGVAALGMLVDTLSYLRRFPEVVEVGKKFEDMLSKADLSSRYVIKAQFEIDGDRDAYERRLEAARATPFDTSGLEKPYRIEMVRGDYAAAEKYLVDSKISSLEGPENVLNDPVALHRALLAYIGGRPGDARAFADSAIATLKETRVTPRQEPFALMDIAKAEAYSGRGADALRDAESALADATAHDAFDAMVLNGELGRIHAVLDDRENALNALRVMLSGPCFLTPGDIRIDPVWSRLKDDPRFEEILKSAKPI